MASIADRKLDRQGRLTYARLMLKGILGVSTLLITHGGDIRKLRLPQASELRYVRPPRRYDLPAYSSGMRAHPSREMYLRPTRHCNCLAPEVIALADALGAFRKPEPQFAQAAFEFAKEKMTLEIAPIGGVEASLQRGTGTCFELIGVFIALCRAAGIPARYKIFATHMVDVWREGTVNADPLLNRWYETIGYFLLEGEGEAFVDGRWMVAHVGPTAERQAAAAMPITRLGEDALGLWFTARTGTVMRLESLPAGLALGSRLLHAISPASMERINVNVLQQIEKGRRIIEEAGGLAAYDAAARRNFPALSPAATGSPEPA